MLRRALIAALLVSAVLAPSISGAGQAAAVSATGKEVLVIKKDDRKIRGRLVSLTPSEVVIQEKDAKTATELTEVRRVERVTHYFRNSLIVGGAASASMFLLTDTSVDCTDCRDAYGMALASSIIVMTCSIGVGALMRTFNARDRILYPVPHQAHGKTKTLVVAPQVSRDRISAAAAIRW